MLPANTIAEITTNLVALNLESNIAAQILAAVFAPLLRTGPNPGPVPKLPQKRARLQLRARKAPQRKKAKRHVPRPAEARERARAAIQANPNATLSALARAAGVSRPTVIAVRGELAAEARRAARRTARQETKAVPKPIDDRRQRAQQFLKNVLAQGPKRVSDVEQAAAKAHIDEVALGQARADLGVVTSRGNSPGNALSVQWSLPG